MTETVHERWVIHQTSNPRTLRQIHSFDLDQAARQCGVAGRNAANSQRSNRQTGLVELRGFTERYRSVNIDDPKLIRVQIKARSFSQPCLVGICMYKENQIFVSTWRNDEDL